MEDEEALKMLEAILAQHRGFGDSDYIHEQLQVWYGRRLNRLAAYLPVAGRLSDTLSLASGHDRYLLIGDTVVRCAVQHALVRLETGKQYGLPVDECERVLEEAVTVLREGARRPLERGMGRITRLGPQPDDSLIWSEDHSDDIFGRAFRQVVRENYGEGLCSPSSEELAMLSRGAQLLSELLPMLSRSALSHAHVVAVFPAIGRWRGTGSSSQFRLAGTIFLSREMLRNPWWVAERLLHESLHQKLYDFRRGHSLFVSNVGREEAPKVRSPWNVHDLDRSNHWDVFRAVAAFHVYVHLGLFCTVAEEREPELSEVYGSPHAHPSMTESRKALERAHYLGEKIRESCWDELGLAGKRLLDWLSSVLDALNPSPPPQGAYLHLLLDLYRKEARRVESRLARLKSVDDPETQQFHELLQVLSELIRDEVQTTQDVLSRLDQDGQLARFNAALSRYSDANMGEKFHEVRGLIADALQGASIDGYRLESPPSGSEDPEEIVDQLVRRSSERLSSALGPRRAG
jgi:hypothetical protein